MKREKLKGESAEGKSRNAESRKLKSDGGTNGEDAEMLQTGMLKAARVPSRGAGTTFQLSKPAHCTAHASGDLPSCPSSIRWNGMNRRQFLKRSSASLLTLAAATYLPTTFAAEKTRRVGLIGA